METAPLASLVWDYDLYPRQGIDSYHVARLAEKMRAGAELPPIIACRKTRKIIDGFHRSRATQRAGRAEIAVTWRDYRDDQARLLDAITANAGHGKAMSSWDEARCVLLADRLGIAPKRLAAAMQVRAEAVGRVRAAKIARDDQARPVAIKATVGHLAGRTLTPVQAEGADRTGGMRATFYINQVVNLIEHDLLDLDDPRVTAKLAELHAALHRLPIAEAEAS